jgi:hypothetical protein
MAAALLNSRPDLSARSSPLLGEIQPKALPGEGVSPAVTPMDQAMMQNAPEVISTETNVPSVLVSDSHVDSMKKKLRAILAYMILINFVMECIHIRRLIKAGMGIRSFAVLGEAMSAFMDLAAICVLLTGSADSTSTLPCSANTFVIVFASAMAAVHSAKLHELYDTSISASVRSCLAILETGVLMIILAVD